MSPHLGQRFVTDRRIGLFTTSNQFAQMMAWFKVKNLMCRYADDVHRPSALKMGLGLATTLIGAKTGKHLPGPALGCFNWQECKEHTMQRCVDYSTMAGIGIGAFLFMLVSVVSSGVGLVCMGKEAHCKKKKKKKAAEWNTAMAGLVSFLFALFAHITWVCGTGYIFNGFKMRAFYPFPFASVGIFGHLFAVLILFAVSIAGYCRQEGEKKKEDEDGSGDEYAPAPAGAPAAAPVAAPAAAAGPPPPAGGDAPPPPPPDVGGGDHDDKHHKHHKHHKH